MKTLILLITLLSFSAMADNAIELAGDLDIVGTGQTADTSIIYNQTGEAVQICIAVQMNGLPPGGGGGGDAGTWDSVTANRAITLTDSGQTYSPDVNGAYTYVSSDDVGYDTSRTDMVKFEVEIQAGGTNGWVGVGWDQSISTKRQILRQNGTQFYRTGLGTLGPSPSLATFSAGTVVSVWLKGTSIWVGTEKAGSFLYHGDPSTATTPISTTLPAATTVYPGTWGYYSADVYRLRTKSADFLSPSLGAPGLAD